MATTWPIPEAVPAADDGRPRQNWALTPKVKVRPFVV